MSGCLIAFEGLDQSGKQTQAGLLRDRLKQEGQKARLVSFPDYGTSIGEEIARLLIANDGADRQLIQALRGYYILRGDMRSGGWEAYLNRSDDFLRFCSHVLVVEMLTLHGGPLKTEKILIY